MTKVKMLVGLSGPAKFYDVGDIYPCDSSEAARLIGARYAIPYVADDTERAVKPSAPETRADPLDHDTAGLAAGSLKGEQSTRAKGRVRK